METYRLSSKLTEHDKEFVIKTSNDVKVNSVLSTVYINGEVTETKKNPHPIEFTPEEVLGLVKYKHEEKKQEVEAMLKCFQKVQETGDADAMYNLGTAFYYRKFYHEAKELFTASLAIKPTSHNAFNYLGITELALGQVEAAINASETAVEMKPNFADYRYNLGNVYFEADLYKDAVVQFKKAIENNLYYADAYLSLALTYLKNAVEKNDISMFKGMINQAVDFIKRAAIINPTYETELLKDSLSALEKKDIDIAYALIAKLHMEKRTERNEKLADYYMKHVYSLESVSEQMLRKRIDFLKSELQVHPTYADLQSDISQCYLKMARITWGNSIEHMKKTLEINPQLNEIEDCLNEAEKAFDTIKHIVSKKTRS